jgi:signal transduction histidine kinase
VADSPEGIDPLLRETLDAVPVALLVLEPDGTVVHANTAFGGLVHRDAAGLAGTDLRAITADPDAHVGEILRRWAGTGSSRPAAVRVRRGDTADEVVLRCDGARIPDGYIVVNAEERTAAVDPFTSLAHELETQNLRQMRSRLQRSLEDLQRTNELLERSNADLERYASVVSHDLRGPLATILGFVDVLDEDHAETLGEDGLLALEAIRRATERMSDVISALLRLARAQPGAPAFETVDPAEAVRDACDQIAAELADAQAEVRTNGLPAVRADRTHLVQLMQNLIGNSVKFRRPEVPPEVRITGERRDEDVVITVVDNGVGIPPEEREQIFAPLRRGRAAREVEGTGIGLATCQRIVELHGGRIEVVEHDEPGAALRFTLPAANGEAG